MMLSKVVAATPFYGNGVGGRMATAPLYKKITKLRNLQKNSIKNETLGFTRMSSL